MNYVGLAIISPTVWHLLEDLRMCHTEARVTFATDKEASKIMGTLWEDGLLPAPRCYKSCQWWLVLWFVIPQGGFSTQTPWT